MKVYVQKVFIRIFFQEQPSISIKVLQIFFNSEKQKNMKTIFLFPFQRTLSLCTHYAFFFEFFRQKTKKVLYGVKNF